MRAATGALLVTALISSCTGTAGPTTSATAGPTAPAGIGADTFLLQDDFETQSGWGVGPAPPTGRTDYGDGTLVISFDIVGSVWSNREVEGRWNVLRVEGLIHLRDAAGAAGLMCGSTRQDHVGGVVNTSGDWFFVEGVDGNTNQLERGDLDVPNPAGVYHVAVECAGTATGALRWRMLVDGDPVASFERPSGPVDFDRAVAFASIGSVDFNAEFDDVVVYGGSEFTGFP
jgi:hypothetical protein